MKEAKQIYWNSMRLDEQVFFVAATDNGLCCVALPNMSFEAFTRLLAKMEPGATLVQDEAVLAPYMLQLEEYFQGKRSDFTLPLDLRGTDFQKAVWEALLKIPYGQTTSYGEVAAYIEKPRAVRAVGGAVGANPIAIVVPCHRVVGKNGTLTGYGGGLPLKTRLLQLEGLGDEMATWWGYDSLSHH